MERTCGHVRILRFENFASSNRRIWRRRRCFGSKCIPIPMVGEPTSHEEKNVHAKFIPPFEGLQIAWVLFQRTLYFS
jgi:hypothetical protein